MEKKFQGHDVLLNYGRIWWCYCYIVFLKLSRYHNDTKYVELYCTIYLYILWKYFFCYLIIIYLLQYLISDHDINFKCNKQPSPHTLSNNFINRFFPWYMSLTLSHPLISVFTLLKKLLTISPWKWSMTGSMECATTL